MKQLGVLDAAFVNLEVNNTPQHIGSLCIYDQSTAPGGKVRFKDLLADFERRTQVLSQFRARVVNVPGGFDRPYWALDESFDVEFHLRHIALPEPGDWRQLCIQIARLHATPLDMSRPLWEAYVIEGLDNIVGLPDDCFAIYLKMHHSLVDGAGSQTFMTAIHDLEPVPNRPAAVSDSIEVDPAPSAAAMVVKGVWNRSRITAELPGNLFNLAKDFVGMGSSVLNKEVSMPDVNSPKTRFNNPVGRHRAVEGVTFNLADIKAIKKAAGVTVNDVALAIVSGAMRRYLENLGELPEEALAAGIPVNMRQRKGETGENNQVGSIFSSLHTNVADPLERLLAINASSKLAKTFGEKSPLVDALKVAGVFPPWVTKQAAQLYARGKLSRFMPVGISTVVTNVPGPPFDLYCAGAKLVRMMGYGVLTPGVGLFHAVFSFSDKISFSILADRNSLPDPAFYHECLEASLQELLEAAGCA